MKEGEDETVRRGEEEQGKIEKTEVYIVEHAKKTEEYVKRHDKTHNTGDEVNKEGEEKGRVHGHTHIHIRNTYTYAHQVSSEEFL